MLHQPIIEDPDVRDAVVDFRPAVLTIRTLSMRVFDLPERDPRRAALQEQIDGIVADMASRAERLDITLDELFRHVNEDLASRPRENVRPFGPYLNELTDENTRAHAAERQLHREIARLQALLPAAIEARIAADRACAGFLAGWAVRGEPR